MTAYRKKILQYIDNRSIGILGCSTEGIATAKFLLKEKIPFAMLDQKYKAELGGEYEKFKRLGVTFHLGNDYLAHMDRYQLLFRTPGMPLWLPHLYDAKKKGCEITSHIKLFFSLAPFPIIGVSGTKGKGTTATLIGTILTKAGLSAPVGGNIGTPPLDFLLARKTPAYAVLELSSFQLEDLSQSPQVAVVLMITQEHLDSASSANPNYHKNLAAYHKAKAHIVKFQKKNDLAIFNADYPVSLNLSNQTPAQTYFFSTKKQVRGAYLVEYSASSRQDIIISLGKKKEKLSHMETALLPGRHNRENMMAAAVTARLLGVHPRVIGRELLSFRGLPNRLEKIKEIRGVSYINDSFSSTPETTIAAIQAYRQPIVLIAGGSEKGSNYSYLGRAIGNSTVKCVILIGDMAKKIRNAITSGGTYKGNILLGPNTMENMVALAQKQVQEGDIVLLSPGCASFDLFKNYKERGELFRNAVDALS